MIRRKSTHPEQYIVDEQGRRKAVIIPVDEWQHILEELEELSDIRAYDEAKSYPSNPVPFEQAVKELHKVITK